MVRYLGTGADTLVEALISLEDEEAIILLALFQATDLIRTLSNKYNGTMQQYPFWKSFPKKMVNGQIFKFCFFFTVWFCQKLIISNGDSKTIKDCIMKKF